MPVRNVERVWIHFCMLVCDLLMILYLAMNFFFFFLGAIGKCDGG
jgi:hypothetical protein